MLHIEPAQDFFRRVPVHPNDDRFLLWSPGDTITDNNPNDDATIFFDHANAQTKFDGDVEFAAGTWTEAEIERVDVALAVGGHEEEH